MSVLTQLSVPGKARPLKIAPEAIYMSSSDMFCIKKKLLYEVHIPLPILASAWTKRSSMLPSGGRVLEGERGYN